MKSRSRRTVCDSLPPNRLRALELLATCRDGCTEAIMLAHGFTARQLVALKRDGFATAHSQRVTVGRRVIEVSRLKITESGRRAYNAMKA